MRVHPLGYIPVYERVTLRSFKHTALLSDFLVMSMFYIDAWVDQQAKDFVYPSNVYFIYRINSNI